METVVFFSTFFIVLSRILGDKNDILPTQVNSWISNENFATIIQLAYPLGACCNIYLGGSAHGVEEIFKQFREIYPYEYVLRRRSYKCEGYFLLGSSDEKITKDMNDVPSSTPNTEILIILNSYVESNSSIFNTALYGIANVNIVSMSGMWTLKENYSARRVFQKYSRFDEMVHHNDHINLHGRELQVSTIYRPPFTYLDKSVNKTINGVQTEVFLDDNDGIEWQLFLIIAKKLNSTWTIRKPEGPYRYGKPKGDKWEGGMIQMLNDHKADLAFGGIWLTYDHSVFVNLSEWWHQLFMNFLVPRPKPTASFSALIRPFSGFIWFLLISAVLLNSLYTYARAWSDRRLPRRFRNFLITFTDLIGCFLGTLSPKLFTTLQLPMILWQTAGWLIITAYCSSLAARLASSEYEDRIDTVQQFIDANLSWGTREPLAEYYNIFQDPQSARLLSRYHHHDNDQQVHQFIMQGNYAVLGKIVDSAFFPEYYIPNEDIKGYRLMRESIIGFYLTFAVQPWLVTPVNRIMLRLKECGIVQFHLRNVLRRHDESSLREVFVEQDVNDGTARVLGLKPLAAAFWMLLICFSIASYVFYLELKHSSGSSSICKVLRDVDRKRKYRNIAVAVSNRRKHRTISLKNWNSIQFETRPFNGTF